MAPAKAGEAERTKLSRSAVVDRALALADHEGLDALTIRRLATELGVTPMALYWHFRNKEELIAGLADRIWGELDTDVDPAPWDVQLRGMLESLMHVLRAHPCASQLILEGEKQSDAALVASETTLDVLRRGGFDPEHAAEIARSALWTGLMLVMSEPGFHPAMSPSREAEAHASTSSWPYCRPAATRGWSRRRCRCPAATRSFTTASASTSSSRACVPWRPCSDRGAWTLTACASTGTSQSRWMTAWSCAPTCSDRTPAIAIR